MSKKILIYLPRADECRSLAHLLFDAGFPAEFYVDRKAAESRLEQGRQFFHLVLCPFESDQSNPFAFVELIRENHPFSPVFLISPKLKLDNITKAIRLGVRDIFNEPLDFAEILLSVRYQLAGMKRNRENAEICARQVEDFQRHFLPGGAAPAKDQPASADQQADPKAASTPTKRVEELENEIQRLRKELDTQLPEEGDTLISTALVELSRYQAKSPDDLGDDSAALLTAYRKIYEALQQQQEEARQLIKAVRIKEQEYEEARLLMNEREAYLEECENTMMEKTQALHEREVELEQAREEVYGQRARLTGTSKKAGQEGDSELERLRQQLEEERRELAVQKRALTEERRKLQDSPPATDPGKDSPPSPETPPPAEEWKRQQKRSKLLRSW